MTTLDTDTDLLEVFCRNAETDIYKDIKDEAWGKNSIRLASFLTMAQLDVFCNFLPKGLEMNLLDLCCGVGETTSYVAAKNNCHAIGVDISTSAIQLAQKTLNSTDKTVIFQLADLKNTMPFPDETFNGIMCLEAIIYFDFPTRLQIFKECYRILKPKGKFIFTDPCVISSIIADQEISGRSIFKGYHFSPKDFQEMLLTKTGFKIIKSEDITEYNAESLSSNWWNARQRRLTQLLSIESVNETKAIQTFLQLCSALYCNESGVRKLSQYAIYAEKK